MTESCPDHSKAFQGNCFSYQRSTTPLRWTAAEELCKQDGGHLASIRSEEEMEIIHTLLTEHSVERGSAVYIGEMNYVVQIQLLPYYVKIK